MKKGLFVLLLLAIGQPLAGQTNDSFSDGDFTRAPAWAGNVSHFIINPSNELQLNDDAAGRSYLETDFVPADGTCEWRVWVKLNFSPSSSNYSRFYLTSDQADLTQPLNGYFLQFGESGSNDAIELFRQTGVSTYSVCRGSPGAIASAFTVRVRVVRDARGNWRLSTDYTGGSQFVDEAAGADTTIRIAAHLGIVCNYTSTNSSKFFFDDFYAGPGIVDHTPPVLDSLVVASSSTLKLAFSEPLNRFSAESTNHYQVDGGIGKPVLATLASDAKTVTLAFSESFGDGTQYLLTIDSITDEAGNVMTEIQVSFIFVPEIASQWKDILFTELFPDPSPQVGLPLAEYAEIYNRTDRPVNLLGWTLADGVSHTTLPNVVLLPAHYLILTDAANKTLFQSLGTVVGLTSFPSLNNDGDVLTLRSGTGTLIDSVTYALAFYHDSDKSDGGWSMELIDPENVCADESNWTASEDATGGTPGRQNSVFANRPDMTGPKLLRASPVDSLSVILTFDEKLRAEAPMPDSFQIDPETAVAAVRFTGSGLTQLLLTLNSPLLRKILYHVVVRNVYDCAGNLIDENFNRADLAVAEAPSARDVVVNEILFNPKPVGTDFVEILNVSAKFFDLRGWKLGNEGDSVAISVRSLTGESYLFAPGAYLALTADPDALELTFPQCDSIHFFRTTLPSLPDNNGSIVLMSDSNEVLDQFAYDKSFHSALIKDDEGVSLERISARAATQDPQNWKSATAQSGFGTPGQVNSNFRTDRVSMATLSIEPEIISPQSGNAEFAVISYRFDHPGLAANLRIVDFQGRVIKTLANNEVLGSTGFYHWDGDADDGTRARMGYYIVWLEVFDLSGYVQTLRRRVIVSSR